MSSFWFWFDIDISFFDGELRTFERHAHYAPNGNYVVNRQSPKLYVEISHGENDTKRQGVYKLSPTSCGLRSFF